MHTHLPSSMVQENAVLGGGVPARVTAHTLPVWSPEDSRRSGSDLQEVNMASVGDVSVVLTLGSQQETPRWRYGRHGARGL